MRDFGTATSNLGFEKIAYEVEAETPSTQNKSYDKYTLERLPKDFAS